MTGQGGKGWNRRWALGAGAAAALGGGYLLSRSSTGGARFEITPEGVFHRGNMSDPGSLDPTYFQSEAEQNILEDLMIGLMTSDPEAKPIPGMATSWTTSEDGLTWAARLASRRWQGSESL